MLSKEERIEELKLRIKSNVDMYDRLKDICSKDDKVLLAIQESIAHLREKLEKFEEE